MENNRPLYRFVEQMIVDTKLRQPHLCLYVAITYMSREAQPGAWFRVTRKKLMRYAGIRSAVTYHKYLAELVRYGFIRYQPSYHPLLGSQIAFNL